MARYIPISPASIVPGLPGDDAAWTTLTQNAMRLYGDSTDGGYSPPLAMGVGHGADDTYLTTTGTSPVEICRVMIPRNKDNEEVMVTVRGSAASGDTGRWAVAYDGGSATGDTTVDHPLQGTIQLRVRPTGSGHPRELVLSHYGVNAGDIVYTYSWSIHIAGLDPSGTGTNLSGYVLPDAIMYTSGHPVTTERVMRLTNAARALAIDRPAGVYSLVEALGHTGARSASGVDSTSPTSVARADLMLVEGAPRTYRVSMYLTADSGVTPKCTVSIGAQSVTGTSTGWTHGGVELGGMTSAVMDAQVSRTAGSGYAYLKTLQIMRET